MLNNCLSAVTYFYISYFFLSICAVKHFNKGWRYNQLQFTSNSYSLFH